MVSQFSFFFTVLDTRHYFLLCDLFVLPVLTGGSLSCREERISCYWCLCSGAQSLYWGWWELTDWADWRQRWPTARCESPARQHQSDSRYHQPSQHQPDQREQRQPPTTLHWEHTDFLSDTGVVPWISNLSEMERYGCDVMRWCARKWEVSISIRRTEWRNSNTKHREKSNGQVLLLLLWSEDDWVSRAWH